MFGKGQKSVLMKKQSRLKPSNGWFSCSQLAYNNNSNNGNNIDISKALAGVNVEPPENGGNQEQEQRGRQRKQSKPIDSDILSHDHNSNKDVKNTVSRDNNMMNEQKVADIVWDKLNTKLDSVFNHRDFDKSLKFNHSKKGLKKDEMKYMKRCLKGLKQESKLLRARKRAHHSKDCTRKSNKTFCD